MVLEPANIGEMKGRRLPLVKRQLYNHEIHGKVLKASKMMLL